MSDDNKRQVIEYVREDGRNLQNVSDTFRDDEEVVAAAILGRHYGGVHVLAFASKRLQDSCREPNSRLVEIISAADKWQHLQERINSSYLSAEEKKDCLQQIEDLKTTLLQKYFSNDQRTIQSEDFYLDNIHISDSLKGMIDRGVIGTSLNHSYDVLHNIATGIYLFLGKYIGIENLDYSKIENSQLLDFVSRKNDLFGIPLRNELIDYYSNSVSYPVLCSFGKEKNIHHVRVPSDVLFAIDMLKLSLEHTTIKNEQQNKVLTFLKTLDFTIATREYVNRNREDATVLMQLERKLKDLFQSMTIDDFYAVIEPYFSSLSAKDVFTNDSIVIEEVTDTAKSIFTNIYRFGLRESAHAILLDGKIQISSDKGYRTPDSEQQDAVGSVVFDSNHFINIVADGVGGVDGGAIG